MNFLTKDIFDLLRTKHSAQQISLYMPTHRTGMGIREDMIRYKNLLKQAEEKLKQCKVDEGTINALLARSRETAEDEEFFKYQSDGLAEFISSDTHEYVSFKEPVEPYVYIGTRFHIRPLIHFLQRSFSYFLLDLQQNSIQLYQGNQYSLVPIDTENIPSSMNEALKFDDPEKQLQGHTASRAQNRAGHMQVHGHGAGDDEQNQRLSRLYQKVCNGLYESVENKDTPLIVGGDDKCIAFFHEVCTYPGLQKASIRQNLATLDEEEIIAQVIDILFPQSYERIRAQCSEFQSLRGKGDTTTATDIETILRSAQEGKVGELFTKKGVSLWGFYDADARKVNQLTEEFSTDKDDLVDLAIHQTLQNGGNVISLSPGDDCVEAKVAALMRY